MVEAYLRTPLHELAIWHRRNLDDIESVVKSLLDQGVDMNAQDYRGNTALHDAVNNMSSHNESFVRVLLNFGANVHLRNKNDDTPLHVLLDNNANRYVCKETEHLDRTAKLLVKAGSDTQARNGEGIAPFNLAVKNVHLGFVNLMLAKITGVEESTLKCEVSWLSLCSTFIREYEHVNELSVATCLGYERVAERLIEMGHHLEQDRDTVWSPLHWAIEANRYEIAKMLLEAGCQVGRRFCWSRFDLRLACLIWELTDISILRQLLLSYFQIITERYSTLRNNKKLRNLLVFYYAIDIHTHKGDNDLIAIKGLIESDEELSLTLRSCNDKLDEMKKVKVSADHSVCHFDILSMDFNSLVKFFNDDNNLKACADLSSNITYNTEIAYYECILKSRIDLAMERQKILDCAKNCLDAAFQSVLQAISNYKCLPDHVTHNILSNLNVKELKIFVN